MTTLGQTQANDTRGRDMAASKATRALGAASLALCSALFLLLLSAATASAAPSHGFSHTIGAASSTPPNPYPLSSPTDVEIEQATGAVYVTDPPNHRVQKFDADGNFILM